MGLQPWDVLAASKHVNRPYGSWVEKVQAYFSCMRTNTTGSRPRLSFRKERRRREVRRATTRQWRISEHNTEKYWTQQIQLQVLLVWRTCAAVPYRTVRWSVQQGAPWLYCFQSIYSGVCTACFLLWNQSGKKEKRKKRDKLSLNINCWEKRTWTSWMSLQCESSGKGSDGKVFAVTSPEQYPVLCILFWKDCNHWIFRTRWLHCCDNAAMTSDQWQTS